MEPFSPPARDAPLRRRAKTADAAGSAAEPAIVSPEQTRHRRSIATSTQNAGNGEGDDDCDHHHLSSCSSSSLGGGLGSSTSGSADLRPYYPTHAPQPLPQLHRRHTYAGGPIAAAAAATTQQRRSVAIEIPAAMKEVVFRHSRSRLLADAGDGQNDNDNDNDAASTVSSLEVDLGHGRSSSHVAEEQEDPRRQFWTERRRGASHNNNASGAHVYSSTNALCGAEGINIGTGGIGTVTDGADQHGGDDDEPSYMSYSLSTSSPCKSARADRCSSKGSINNNKRAAAAKKNQHHRRDSSLLGGLGLLEITPAAAAANSAAGAGAAVSGADGRRSASLLHQSDSLLSRRAASQAPQACHHRHPPKRRSLSHHRRHNSESILPNTSIGTDTTAETEGTGSIGNCLSPPPPPPRHQFGPSLSSLLQHFSAGNNGTGSDKPGHSGRAGETAKTMHRRCSSAGCGVAIA